MQRSSLGLRSSFFLVLSVVVSLVIGGAAARAEAQTFTDVGALGLPAMYSSSVAWGDYDNDGDLDAVLLGLAPGIGYITRVYRNDAGVFTDSGAVLLGCYMGSVAWGDYDNDGDLDILLTGACWASGWSYVAKVYRNDGGTFTDIGAALTGVRQSAAAWGDYDNDGDLDILLAGHTGSAAVAKVYRNDAGAFTDISAGLTGFYSCAVAWGDYDNDGDLDILMTGNGAKLYRNDGGGFTEVGTPLRGAFATSVAWGDYDNDGDLDILATGDTGSGLLANVYRNDAGSFTDIGAGMTGVSYGSAAWGDYDNDGDLDVLLTGNDWYGGVRVGKVYRNDAGAFTDIGAGLAGVQQSSVAWGDYDNDGDLDILLTGTISDYSGAVARVYRNDSLTTNTVPAAPTGLAAATPGGNRVELRWTAASDAQTPSAGLTYNLRIGSSPGASDILSPMAAASGARRIPALGNAQHGTSAVLTPAASPGTYYWSVQAVDTAFGGSAFASEGSFAYCGYSLSPRSQDVAIAATSGSIAVTAGSWCAWTAVSSDPSWLMVTSGSPGLGDGSVGYSVAANTGAARSATITVGEQIFTVNQAAARLLTVAKAGAGSGSVSSSPAGISCGGDCSEYYDHGATVTLTASADAGSLFSGWSGDCTGTANPLVITMDVDKSCTASFDPTTVVIATRSKTVSGGFNINGSVAYAITLSNTGNSTQPDNSGPELVDVLPSSLTLVSAETTSGAAVADVPGNAVTWNGSIASGGSVTITINATVKPTVALGETISNQATIGYDADVDGTNESTVLSDDPAVAGPSDPTSFVVVSPSMALYTLTPCRVVDTRGAEGTYGGPALAAGAERVFPLFSRCGIPATARAVSVNLTATQATSAGNLRLYPAGTPRPAVSAINYAAGQTRANNAVAGLNGLGELTIYCAPAPGSVHFIIDVNGYFE
jgi:uncharacterized repeat protein (TIGR01451 family)